MYKDNQDLWGDCTEREAYINYARSNTGHVDSARLLMEFSMVPSVKTAGASKLHDAAAAGNLEELERLLDVEATGTALVDPTKHDGTTPLITAAMMGHEQVVRRLIEEGADVEAVGLNGATALQIAASMGHVGVMTALLDGGAQVNAAHKFAKSTALHFAAEMGQVAAIELLCKRGADPHAEKTHGGTALHISADSNQSMVAYALLHTCHADPHRLLMGDTTALYLAAQKGYTEVCRLVGEPAVCNVRLLPPTGGQGSSGGRCQPELCHAIHPRWLFR